MSSAFRRLSKSKVGTGIMVLFLVLIVGSFAVADMNNLGGGFVTGSGTIAKVGGEQVTERDLSTMFDRALTQQRRENPEITPAALAGQFDQIVDELVNERLMAAFAADNDIILSRRLVDAQIANLPQAKGLDGKFSEQGYARWLQSENLTDAWVRRLISTDILQRTILLPVAASPRMSVGMATPYASVLLEQRQGEVALVLTDAFKQGLTPTVGDLQAFYNQNKGRYMVPEQRVLRFATIAADKVPVPAPTDQEIAAYYKANAATYGGEEKRVISQAVVQDQKVAAGIAARAKSGTPFAAAAAPAGLSAEDVSVGPQSKSEFTGLAGATVANTVFSAASGAIVGPVKSDLGWHVIRIDSVQPASGKSLAAARAEIVTKLTADKRKDAVADAVSRVEDAIADGASFADAARASGLAITDTPLINSAGKSPTDPAYTVPANYAPALKSGFDLSEDDDPVVDELADKSGYVIVGLGRLVPAAPAPLASIRDRVATDWVQKRAADQARAVASSIAAKVAAGQSLADATKAAGKGVSPPSTVTARRIQLRQADQASIAPLRMLFSLPQGKSRMVADPQQRGFFIVRTTRIVPGNASTNPGIISRVQVEMQQTLSQELAQQFMSALRKDIGVKRNEDAIAAAKKRLTQVTN